MSNIIKQISAKAKTLYKSGKYKKWTDAIKAASKLVKGSAPSKKSSTPKRKKSASKKISGSKKTHTDTKSHNVKIRIGGFFRELSENEIQFLESEGKNSKGHKYRGKILWGQPVVLKETKNGTPVKKWIVDDLKTADYLSAELNKGQKYTRIKGKKI